MYRFIIILTMLALAAAPAYGQQVMTLEDAIRIGLQNNYDIRIARNTAEVAQNNKGQGTAGFLPTLDVSGSYSLSSGESEDNISVGTSESESEAWTGQASLSWTLFDGFTMFTNRKIYNEQARLGDYQMRNTIENNVVAITRAYFDLVQQQQLLEVDREARDVSLSRYEREKVRNELGGASTTDLLNAQVSYNSDLSTFLDQQLQVTIARQQLNVVLGRAPETPVEVTGEIVIPELNLQYADIYRSAEERNSDLMLARQNRIVADYNVKAARAPFMPRLVLTAGYSYSDRTSSNTPSTYDFDINTTGTDASLGLRLSMNIFNGNRDRISLKNAVLESTNKRLTLQKAENELAGQVRERFDTYLQRVELMRLEEQNVVAARQNLELQQDSYELGATTSIEYRDAQVNLVRAQTSLITARYQARISRLEIDQLIGNIAIE